MIASTRDTPSLAVCNLPLFVSGDAEVFLPVAHRFRHSVFWLVASGVI